MPTQVYSTGSATPYHFTLPGDVCFPITITVAGASGGGGGGGCAFCGGGGGCGASATKSYTGTRGETLTIYVGTAGNGGAAGGMPGGTPPPGATGGAGGASVVYNAAATLVAAADGGFGGTGLGVGGAGGSGWTGDSGTAGSAGGSSSGPNGGIGCNGGTGANVGCFNTGTGGSDGEVTITYTTGCTSTFNVFGSGGCVVGGDSPIDMPFQTVIPFGGMVCGGSASYGVMSRQISTGGVLLGGLVSFALQPLVATGGIVCGGSARLAHISTVVSTGGVILGSPAPLYRIPVTISAVPETLRYFLVPVSAQIDPDHNPTGAFSVHDTASNALPFDLREYDPLNGFLFMVVKVTVPTAGTKFYIGYGGLS